MSFKSNDSQQITLNDALFGLTDREKRMLEKSWAKPFAEKIFPKINESLFACLYSDKHHVQTHLLMYVLELATFVNAVTLTNLPQVLILSMKPLPGFQVKWQKS